MSAAVTLLRDTGAGEPVLELLPWFRPTAGDRYWHMPRAARRPAYRAGLTVYFWCGQVRSSVPRSCFTATVSPRALRCGTCVGRRRGFDRNAGLIFRPRDPFGLPSRCPGRGPMSETRECDGCGRRCNAPRWHGNVGSHRPEPALLDWWTPCPEHAWSHFRIHGTAATCHAWGVDDRGYGRECPYRTKRRAA